MVENISKENVTEPHGLYIRGKYPLNNERGRQKESRLTIYRPSDISHVDEQFH